jgi:acyl carrier protein
MTADADLTLEAFAAALCEIAHVSPDAAHADTRLLEDLALDSLALANLVAALVVDFEMRSLDDGLPARSWTDVTFGDLYEEYRTGRPPKRTAKHSFEVGGAP